MKSIIENWQGSDADLLVELNTPQHKRVIGDGLVTLAMIGQLGADVAASVAFTLDSVIANLPTGTMQELATKSLLQKFSDRLCVSDRGLDFSNDVVRAQVSQVLSGAGWQQVAIDAILGLGAVYDSTAYKALGRDATSDDITQVRFEIACDEARAEVKRRNDAADDAAREAIRQMKTYVEIIAAASNAWGA